MNNIQIIPPNWVYFQKTTEAVQFVLFIKPPVAYQIQR